MTIGGWVMRMGASGYWIVALCVGGVAAIAVWAEDRLAYESSPVARGAAYAGGRGCIECHGNPELATTDDRDCSDKNRFLWHPDYEFSCVDLLSYFAVIRLRRTFGERAASANDNLLIAGEGLARQYHCFQCHGPLGQGGFANAGSLKGYVPGYFGDDFRQLTRNANPESIRHWIERGMDDHLIRQPIIGPIAQFFVQRQAVGMPSFGSLGNEDIDILVHYVIALHKFGPMTANTVRAYDRQSRSPTRAFASVNGRAVSEPERRNE